MKHNTCFIDSVVASASAGRQHEYARQRKQPMNVGVQVALQVARASSTTAGPTVSPTACHAAVRAASKAAGTSVIKVAVEAAKYAVR